MAEKVFTFEQEFPYPDIANEKQSTKLFTVTVWREGRKYNDGFAAFFQARIPDELYEYLRNNHPDYLDKTDTEKNYWENKNRKFKQIIQEDTLQTLSSKFASMMHDALFLKKLTRLDENNKVLFVKCTHNVNSKRDDYNHADQKVEQELRFHYFPAFEIIEETSETRINGTGPKSVFYGLTEKKGMYNINVNPRRNHLPLIPHPPRDYVKIKWTKEREAYLEAITKKIEEISNKIKSFTEQFTEDKIDLLIGKQQNLLEDHTEETK